jgi:hypothetical protein
MSLLPLTRRRCASTALLGAVFAAIFAVTSLSQAAVAQGLPARAAQAAHKGKRVKNLPSQPATTPAKAATGPQEPSSPYARAAASHNEARALAATRAQVRTAYPTGPESAAR